MLVQTSPRIEEKQVINDWTDCWFGINKRTGYVTVTDLENMPKFYGANDISELKRYTEGIEKRYISLNGFTFGSRKSADLKQIRNIGIDIDQYKLGLTIEETLDRIQALVVEKSLPEPNLILTSRGIQIFYTIANGAAPNMGFLASYITDQFIGKLKHLGADGNAKDLSRVMRVPYSINERNSAIVKPTVWNDTKYTLEYLQSYCKPLEVFKTSKRKKAAVTRFLPKQSQDKLSYFYRTNYNRLADLEKLITLRDGYMTGMRNTFLYIYAYHQSLICNSLADLEVFMFDVYDRIKSRTDKPLSKNELKRTFKSAYKDAEAFYNHFKANGYQVINKQNDGIKKPYKTSNLIKMLEITEEEQQQLKNIISSDVKRGRETERKRQERRSAGMGTNEEYQEKRKVTQQERINQLRELLLKNPELNNAELSRVLGVSVRTVQRLSKHI